MQDDSLTLVNTPEISDRKKIMDALMASFFLLLLMWTAYAMDHMLGFDLNRFGLRPRSLEGLRGIFTIHFLHGSFSHIWQNSISLLVMNSFLFYFYRSISLKIFGWLMIVPAVLLWLGGRPENHIGASMLIYGEAAFLFVSGFIRDNLQMLRVSLVIALYYGGLVWYLFPVIPQISWEGHLSGAITGVILAFAYKTKGPQRKKYNWEIDEELELEQEKAQEQEQEKIPGSHHQTP